MSFDGKETESERAPHDKLALWKIKTLASFVLPGKEYHLERLCSFCI